MTNSTNDFQEKVKKFKESELRMLRAEEEELLALRSITDNDLVEAERIKYKGIDDFYALKNDIDDGISIVSSLTNMVENRNDFRSLGRMMKLIDGLYYFIEELYTDSEKYSK